MSKKSVEYSTLANKILFEPLKLEVNRLCIVSGYATPNMASWMIKNLKGFTSGPINIDLIVGMVPFNGLSISVHEGFKELQNEKMPSEVRNYQCSYVCDSNPVNSKVYIWLRDERPILAFAGSSDFIQSSFGIEREEYMVECNPDEAYRYYCNIEKNTIYCNHAEVEECILLYPTHSILDMENRPVSSLSGEGIKSVNLSLLARNGETGKKSGLNWGQRAKRNKNEAYIALPTKVAREEFFPLCGQHFTVITDDGHQLILRVEQDADKAITTPLSNAQLGEYFRNRLGMANGAYVWREDLENYGRTDVTFYKLDDEQYYMDFSV